jgi:hypothetical protein
MDQPINKRRRWLGFSLRMMLFAVTLLCVWLGFKVNAARRQKEAIQAVLGAGATVNFDYQYKRLQLPVPLPKSFGRIDARVLPDYTIDSNAESAWPLWLRSRFGDDYFRNVIAVYFNHPNLKARTQLGELAKLPRLMFFVLDSRGLEWHPNDDDLSVLENLNYLQSVQLMGATINGSVLARLHHPERLTNVCLSHTQVDDNAMRIIGNMVNLDRIWLDGTRITDVGTVHLERLNQLKLLYLQDTNISDRSLVHLKMLKSLLQLEIGGTAITEDGVSELQRSLPNAKIGGRIRSY